MEWDQVSSFPQPVSYMRYGERSRSINWHLFDKGGRVRGKKEFYV
jgi:hypothetical protein